MSAAMALVLGAATAVVVLPWPSCAVRLYLRLHAQLPAAAHHFSFQGRSTTSKAQVDRCWRCNCR